MCGNARPRHRVDRGLVKPIISPHIRIRHPEFFVVGQDSIIDDFCYFSTKVEIGYCCHIASCCTIAGGAARQFRLGDYSSISAGVRIWCTSDDFVNDVVAIIPEAAGPVKENLIFGDVELGAYTAVGANSVVMPRNCIPEGTTIGAMSFVPVEFPFEAWSVYAGIPIRLVAKRNRPQVLAQVEKINSAMKHTGVPNA